MKTSWSDTSTELITTSRSPAPRNNSSTGSAWSSAAPTSPRMVKTEPASGARRGRLIAFEGTEGAGKSTQIERAASALHSRGFVVRVTREPGATPLGRKLRELVMHTTPPPVPPAELFLYLADRAQHLAE